MNESAHEALLARWSNEPHHHGRVFVSDGAIDPTLWRQAPRRIAFLLKEAYGGVASWDIRREIREVWGSNLSVTLRNSAYLAFAGHYASGTNLREIPSEHFEAARQSLLASALINIKKSGGTSNSDERDIENNLHRDAAFIHEQIEILNPEIIVCGGTWYCAKNLWPDARYVYDMVWTSRERYFIDFWHPGYFRADAQVAYYAFAGLLLYGGILAAVPQREPPPNMLLETDA